jgi:hypothetical protein
MKKRVVYFMSIVFSILFVMACKSTPTATADSDAGGTEQTDGGDESLLLDIYSDYQGIVTDGAKEYTVKKGDTLSGIAKANYGEGVNGYFFPLIMFASKVIVVDPDKINPGQQLTIPDLQKNLNDIVARLQIKALLLDIAFIYDFKADHTKSALKARNETDRDGLVALSRSL